MKLHRDLGIGQKAAWHLAHRICTGWSEDHEELFSGPVETDEACFGKQRIRHRGDREYVGRGPVGKAIVAGIRDRETNRTAQPTGTRWRALGTIAK